MSLAGFFAGIAGALATINYEIITAEALGLMASGNVVLMAFIGGIGQFWGPIIGAVLVTFLQSALSNYTQAWLLYFGLLFLIIILYSPGGIANLVTMHSPVVKAGLVRRLIPSYTRAVVSSLILGVGVIAVIELLYRGAEAIGVSPLVSWLTALALVLIGAVMLAKSSKKVSQLWDELSPELAKWS